MGDEGKKRRLGTAVAVASLKTKGGAPRGEVLGRKKERGGTFSQSIAGLGGGRSGELPLSGGQHHVKQGPTKDAEEKKREKSEGRSEIKEAQEILYMGASLKDWTRIRRGCCGRNRGGLGRPWKKGSS